MPHPPGPLAMHDLVPFSLKLVEDWTQQKSGGLVMVNQWDYKQLNHDLAALQNLQIYTSDLNGGKTAVTKTKIK